MKSITFSHKGRRDTNQDYLLCKTIGPDTYIFLIVDGMGGYEDGDVAARIVAESIADQFSEDLGEDSDLQHAIDEANIKLKKASQKSGRKLGATIGGILLQSNTAICFWVGDVKIIHFRNRKLVFESKSHSLLNEILESGSIRTSFRAEKYKHVVTRSVQGDSDRSEIDIHTIDGITEADLFMVCSDGVHDVLSGMEIEGMYKKALDFSELVQMIEVRIINESNDNGSLIAFNRSDEMEYR